MLHASYVRAHDPFIYDRKSDHFYTFTSLASRHELNVKMVNPKKFGKKSSKGKKNAAAPKDDIGQVSDCCVLFMRLYL